MSENFKDDVLFSQEVIMDKATDPAQGVAIALTIAVNIATLHLRARTFKVGISGKVYEVEIKEMVK